ncbi:outer membrane protein assembly factor BamE [Sphingobium boeckii]|uniref:Outer membrane protein assembly factor BamE (Lipoprotein component of BamABCDE complex) n=1 Tax=Sphingobium boeckii TaxID=1082345 RepID=A0A7W9ECF8_9SPHN|nr:outer membrane protein assembly factor BamE [Sphingobium boeckii]MBB5684228.1 outer membrane protein assembly factor BamE (lipoprotein component of BamABCDE complex) [Sphingobium boeckii]
MGTTLRTGMIMAASLVALVATSGCTRVRGNQGYLLDQQFVQGIQPGVDNRDSVEATLGRPSFTGQFGTKDWYYFSRTTQALAFAMPRAKEQTLLHIQFDDAGNVSTVQKTGVETIASISPMGDTTPTLGRHRGFFQELFGNIGAVGSGMGGGAPQQ